MSDYYNIVDNTNSVFGSDVPVADIVAYSIRGNQNFGIFVLTKFILDSSVTWEFVHVGSSKSHILSIDEQTRDEAISKAHYQNHELKGFASQYAFYSWLSRESIACRPIG